MTSLFGRVARWLSKASVLPRHRDDGTWCSGHRRGGSNALHDADPSRRSRPRQAPPSRWGDYAAFNEAAEKAGIAYQPGNRLQPSSAASTVRVAGDKTAVLDGPYADTQEQLAGYFMIDVPYLDQAIAWAARHLRTQLDALPRATVT